MSKVSTCFCWPRQKTLLLTLGLAFKRAGRFSHADRMYREALRDLPSNGQLNETSLDEVQCVRRNLLNLLVVSKSTGVQLREVGLELFGGEAAVRMRLSAGRRSLLYANIEVQWESYENGKYACRLTVDGQPETCSLVLHEMESTPKLMQSKPVVTSHGMTLRIIDQPSEDTATQSKPGTLSPNFQRFFLLRAI